jgi:GAF domain-containing protein
VPRSIAAVPLVDGEQTVGVLQVLDKHTSPTFSLRDMELLAVFARQAAAAIRAARVQRDSGELLRAVLHDLGDGELSETDLEAVVSAAASELDRDPEQSFWQVVDSVARLRSLGDREQLLVADILQVIAQHAGRGRHSV